MHRRNVAKAIPDAQHIACLSEKSQRLLGRIERLLHIVDEVALPGPRHEHFRAASRRQIFGVPVRQLIEGLGILVRTQGRCAFGGRRRELQDRFALARSGSVMSESHQIRG